VRITHAMAMHSTPVSEPDPTKSPTQQRPGGVLVAEDWLLAVWVALASPLLFRVQGGSGPFDGGAPLIGVIRLAAVLGALLGLAARREPGDATPRGRSIIESGAVGPLCGGLLLVALSGFTALDVTSGVGLGVAIAAAVAMIAMRVLVPPLGLVARRALVTPFVMVAGGLFWTFIAAISGEPGSATPASAISNPQTGVAAAGFLLAFSAVYYAMLVYAPRQVAQREGGAVTWVIRYALFVAGVTFGLAWPRLFGA
jgi:hypothetical protein